MKAEIQAKAEEIRESLALLRRFLDWDTALRRLDELNAAVEDPSLWDDAARARRIMSERSTLERQVTTCRDLEQQLADSLDLIELAEMEGDDSVLADAEATVDRLAAEAGRMRFLSLLSGEADANDCFVEIHAGAGGTDSQDWAEMLSRMYARWAEAHGFKVDWLEESQGEEAGIKSATLRISGDYAYGWLKTESGVHRLVRISPFDSNARRQTGFASAWIYPVVEDTIEITVDPKDLRVDTYRASGAGGQHVNKTSSAVRLTHLPTGIVVACQNDRSQHRNRDTAMQMLKARLYERELQKREAEAQAIEAAKSDIGWGHQIRSYVLHPYQMVKDLRTEAETGNVQAVLDGDIDMFLEASLAARVGEGDGDGAAGAAT
ncbi:MAG: peptide chain release factor 2 [Alphaproteobacteria bacterium]